MGTPPGTQLDCAVKALFLPASTSSISFFMCSFTHGLRFGLVRSAMRNVGCLLVPLGTKGCAGSLTTGAGSTPGAGSKNGPVPLKPTQPAWFEEKSGGAAFCCAAAGAKGITAMRLNNPAEAASTVLARSFPPDVNGDIVSSLFG